MLMLTKGLLVGFLLGITAASVLTVYADKNVVIKSLKETDFRRLTVDSTLNSPTLRICGTYQLTASDNVPVSDNRTYCQDLTPAQRATFLNFLKSDVNLQTGANAVEGL